MVIPQVAMKPSPLSEGCHASEALHGTNVAYIIKMSDFSLEMCSIFGAMAHQEVNMTNQQFVPNAGETFFSANYH